MNFLKNWIYWILLVLIIFLIKQTLTETFVYGKPVFMFVYVDWCGYCKKMKPIMKKIDSYYEANEHVDIQMINAEDPKNNALMKRLGINSYPTILYFPTGVIRREFSITYTGERSFDDIVSFLKNKIKF